MQTLVISKKDIPALLPMSQLIERISNAYVIYSTQKTVKPQRVTTQVDETSVVINLPGYLPDVSQFTVKVNVKVPSNPSKGLPFLRGVIHLFDQHTGQLLAIMDSALITAMRTGAAGACGISSLANPSSHRVALVGAGVQAEWQIKALCAIREISQITIYDIIDSHSLQLAKTLHSELQIKVDIVSSAKEAIQQSDIVIVTTQSKTPIITTDMLHPGLHINAFGADQPGKVELAAEVFKENRVIVDDLSLALSDGALNVAYKNQLLDSNPVYPEIGEVISNPACGRLSAEEITIFANVGLAFQDLVACSIIYENAVKLEKRYEINLDPFLF